MTGKQLGVNTVASAARVGVRKSGCDQRCEFVFQFCILTRFRKIVALDRPEPDCACTFIGVEPSQKRGGFKRTVIVDQHAVDGYGGVVGGPFGPCQDDNFAADGALQRSGNNNAAAVERAATGSVEQDTIEVIVDLCPQPGPHC